MDNQARGYLAISIAIIGWGASSPFIELGLRSGITPIPFLTYRFLLATVLLTPYVMLKRRDIFGYFKIPLVWIVGISESMGLIFQYLGQQQQVPAGLAALLSLLFLIIVPFLSPFLLDEKLQSQHIVAVMIALVGVGLITTDGDLTTILHSNISLLGVGLLILAAISYAFYLVFTSKLRTTDDRVDTFGIFYAVMVIISLTSGLTMALRGQIQPLTNFDFLVWLILLVIFSTIIAFIAYFEAMTTINANLASILLLLQVFVAFLFDFLLIGNTYTINTVFGSIIILIAMYIAVTTKPKKITKTPKNSNNNLSTTGGD